MLFQASTWKENDLVEERFSLDFTEDREGVENEVINLYPEISFEELEGFGGAITDAAGYVYSLMSEEQKRSLMREYFSKEGMNYNMVRIHIDSCDFSTEMYEAMSDPEDRELCSFDFSATERYIIPMLRDADQAYGGGLPIMLTPWSPPAFMKDNQSRKLGGKLKPEYRSLWAEYICRYIREFQDRGFYVNRLSVQNEPKAVQTWDSCIFTAEEEKEFLRDYLYPAMQKHGYGDIEIFIWDHNKERVFERALAVIDETTRPMISGIAFHWYSGDHFEALELTRRAFPEMKLMISESCIEYSKFGAGENLANAKRLAHEIIGDLNAGMSGFYDWNLLLDEKGGPNHVGNYCHAPFLYDTGERKLLPQCIARYFFHFSHYLKKGAKRIGYSKYRADIEVSAFEGQDGSIVLILLNRGEQEIPICLRLHGKMLRMVVKANTILTGVEKI